MSNVHESMVEPKFPIGTCVRVKSGVMDPDIPGMDLRDWMGTVFRFAKGKHATYLIHWSPQTLRRMDPACRDFCEREDVDFDRMWLLEDDLSRAALSMEHFK